jgi:hypothetical protein
MLRPFMLHTSHALIVISETVSTTARFNSGAAALMINKVLLTAKIHVDIYKLQEGASNAGGEGRRGEARVREEEGTGEEKGERREGKGGMGNLDRPCTTFFHFRHCDTLIPFSSLKCFRSVIAI